MIYVLEQCEPKIAGTSYVAPTAAVIGDVHIGEQASIWFNAVIRGDTGRLLVGPASNIQDNSVLHTDEGVPFAIGTGVTIGHNCVIHGCTIGDNSLIGMGSTILNHVRIGKNCIIGANSLVTQGTTIPDNSLALGSPCKVVRRLGDEEVEKNRINAQIYVKRGEQYMKHLRSQE